MESEPLQKTPHEKTAPIKVVLAPGARLLVTLDGTDGDFEIYYDYGGDGKLRVTASGPDSAGRDAEIYCDSFGSPRVDHAEWVRRAFPPRQNGRTTFAQLLRDQAGDIQQVLCAMPEPGPGEKLDNPEHVATAIKRLRPRLAMPDNPVPLTATQAVEVIAQVKSFEPQNTAPCVKCKTSFKLSGLDNDVFCQPCRQKRWPVDSEGRTPKPSG